MNKYLTYDIISLEAIKFFLNLSLIWQTLLCMKVDSELVKHLYVSKNCVASDAPAQSGFCIKAIFKKPKITIMLFSSASGPRSSEAPKPMCNFKLVKSPRLQ